MEVLDAPCSCYYAYFLAVFVCHFDGCVLVSHMVSIYIFLMVNVDAYLSYVCDHLGIFWEEFVQVFCCCCSLKEKQNILSVFPFLFISKIEPNIKSTMIFVGEGENHGNVAQIEVCICSFFKQMFFEHLLRCVPLQW